MGLAVSQRRASACAFRCTLSACLKSRPSECFLLTCVTSTEMVGLLYNCGVQLRQSPQGHSLARTGRHSASHLRPFPAHSLSHLPPIPTHGRSRLERVPRQGCVPEAIGSASTPIYIHRRQLPARRIPPSGRFPTGRFPLTASAYRRSLARSQTRCATLPLSTCMARPDRRRDSPASAPGLAHICAGTRPHRRRDSLTSAPGLANICCGQFGAVQHSGKLRQRCCTATRCIEAEH
jgi:hypothetical protein